MADDRTFTDQQLQEGLARIRRRRRLLWGVILIYVPGLMIALQAGATGAVMTKLFGAWIGLLCFAVGWATIVKCPRCGNNFHTNGPTFFPVRQCVHCGLHVKGNQSESPG